MPHHHTLNESMILSALKERRITQGEAKHMLKVYLNQNAFTHVRRHGTTFKRGKRLNLTN